MAKDDFVTEQFDDAYRLQEEKSELMERINANRSILRTLRTAGKLSQPQDAELEEIYPTRVRNTDAEPAAE